MTKELRRTQETKAELYRQFEAKLEASTDPANAVVLGMRAYWMSKGTLCYINLKKPVDA